ncbi:MAG: hypothetical protein OXF66_09880, partial [Gammaproteobacteria bacterium]|nr:hypothetical protein [Gammaproteobacteria bacterium]
MTLIETLMDGFQGGSCAGAPKPKIWGGGGGVNAHFPLSPFFAVPPAQAPPLPTKRCCFPPP